MVYVKMVNGMCQEPFFYFTCVLLLGCLQSVSSCCSYIYAALRSQGDGEMKLQSLPLKKITTKKQLMVLARLALTSF